MIHSYNYNYYYLLHCGSIMETCTTSVPHSPAEEAGGKGQDRIAIHRGNIDSPTRLRPGQKTYNILLTAIRLLLQSEDEG